MKRLVAILTLIVSLGLSAQELRLDTLKIKQSLADTTFTLPPLENYGIARYNFQNSYRYYPDSIDTSIPDIVPRTIDISAPGQAGIITWQNGGAVAYGGSQDLPGMMGIESGAVNMYQTIGNLTIGIGGDATKYGYFRGLNTQYGLNGSLSYQINPSNSVTLFGNYYFGNTPNTDPRIGAAMTPAMIGYYNSSRIGGYISHDFNRRWGIDLGAQSYRPLGSTHWEVAPIVAPYVRLNNGHKVGIDAGGIIYSIIRDAAGKNLNWGPNNPTIGPPQMGLGAIGH